jgi:hypothetical protein
MTGWRNASQFPRATCLEVRNRLLGQPIEFAGFGISLDLLVEMRRLELLEPSAKLLELIVRQLGDGSLDIFKGRHGQSSSDGASFALI